jgi:hypothetical protein
MAISNVFDGASSSFRILYLGGRSGFVGPEAEAWLDRYQNILQPFQDDSRFEFTSANGTVEITRFIGVPPFQDKPLKSRRISMRGRCRKKLWRTPRKG